MKDEIPTACNRLGLRSIQTYQLPFKSTISVCRSKFYVSVGILGPVASWHTDKEARMLADTIAMAARDAKQVWEEYVNLLAVSGKTK